MLTGQYAVNFLQGIQHGKEDSKHTQIVGTCKHFVANSIENWYNYSRHNYDAKVSKADLADYYFPACERPFRRGPLPTAPSRLRHDSDLVLDLPCQSRRA